MKKSENTRKKNYKKGQALGGNKKTHTEIRIKVRGVAHTLGPPNLLETETKEALTTRGVYGER